MLVSAVQWSESAKCIHIFPSSWTSVPPHPLPISPGNHKAPCTVQKLTTRYLFYAWSFLYVNPNLQVHLPFSSLPVSTCLFFTSMPLRMIHAQSPSCVWIFVASLIVACQAPLPMGFSRLGCWSTVPVPTAGDLPSPGIKSVSLVSLAGGFFTTSATQEAKLFIILLSTETELGLYGPYPTLHPHPPLAYKKKKNYWRIVDLQCCVSAVQ